MMVIAETVHRSLTNHLRRGCTKKVFWVSFLATTVLAGCALLDTPQNTAVLEEALKPETSISPDWTSTNWDTGAVDDAWIESFGDPELVVLVDEAIANNLNLQVMSAQVERAVGVVQLATAGLQPSVAIGANSASVASTGSSVETEREIGVAASWEADVWGRVRAGINAAEQSLAATQADYEGARLSLAAHTAQAWFLAKETRMQVQFAEETVSLLTELASRVKTSLEVGAISRKDLDLAEADLAAAENALRQAVVAKTQTVRALELLLGRYPAASLEISAKKIAVPPPVPVGMPSELLERRPDLIGAERRVAAAFFLEEQAQLMRMPKFTISGSLSGATSLSGIVSNMLAGVTVPLYAPALEAQIAIATADQQAAVAAYGQAILVALKEVETALFNEQIYAEREQFLESQVTSEARALEVYRKQFEVGQISILPLLQVQARYIGSQVVLTRIQNERLALRIDLHLALGGSF